MAMKAGPQLTINSQQRSLPRELEFCLKEIILAMNRLFHENHETVYGSSTTFFFGQQIVASSDLRQAREARLLKRASFDAYNEWLALHDSTSLRNTR